MDLNTYIAAHGVPLRCAAGDVLFWQGDPSQHLYFVQSGLLKAAYALEDGREFIKSFLVGGDMIGSLNAMHGGGTCTFTLSCLEDVELTQLSFQSLRAACRCDVALSQDVMEVLLNFGMKKEKREYELLSLSAEERFAALLDKDPAILAKVRQKDLARYLGITPVAFSRIKKRHRGDSVLPASGTA